MVLRHAAAFGGTGMDNAWVLGIDAAGVVHVGSNSCGDGFPTTPLAYAPARRPAAGTDVNDACDVAIARFTESPAGFSLAYGSYLGGSGADFVAGLAVTGGGADWVVGGTSSGDFPTVPGAPQAANRGGFDAFVTRLSASGRALGSSTYFGGSGYDYPFDVALDASGNPHVAGRTESSDFPVTAGSFQQANAGSSDAFVAQLTRVGDVAWSTLLGGTGFDWPFAIAVGGSGAVYVAGLTRSADFPTLLAAQNGPGGADDAFVARLSRNGSALRWSTLLGGPGAEQAHGLALDGAGGVWVAGTSAGGLTTSADATQPSFGGGGNDAFLVRLDEAASVRLRPSALRFPRTRVGRSTAPRQVVVTNTGQVPVDVLGVSVGGADPGDFVLTNGCPATLAPGAACSVDVRFTPAAAGPRAALLQVGTSASAAPSTVALSGTGF
ncbi:MAG: choice-of-anchor D domain-containing protein [Vicinamibacteria bacterium]